MNRFLRIFALGLLVLLTSLPAPPAGAAALVPPPGYYAPVPPAAAGNFDCPPAPPPYTAVLDFPSKYEGSGKARDQLNDEADRRYRELTLPITSMEKGATGLVSQYMSRGQPQVLDCVLSWYGAWAQARALLGPAANHTGRSLRKWALASLSTAWLRLQFSSSQPLAAHAEQARAIQSWLVQIAEQVRQEWDTQVPLQRINNHYYWAAWAVMATAVSSDRRDLFDWATSVYGIFATQVDAQGYLPNEMARQTRAAGYQVYAVTPVAMMAAFAKANGVDLAGSGNQALRRAAEKAVSAYDDPRAFAAITGQQQTLDGADEQSSKLAWLEPYCWTLSCTPGELDKLKRLRPMKNTRLGGDVSAEFAR